MLLPLFLDSSSNGSGNMWIMSSSAMGKGGVGESLGTSSTSGGELGLMDLDMGGSGEGSDADISSGSEGGEGLWILCLGAVDVRLAVRVCWRLEWEEWDEREESGAEIEVYVLGVVVRKDHGKREFISDFLLDSIMWKG